MSRALLLVATALLTACPTMGGGLQLNQKKVKGIAAEIEGWADVAEAHLTQSGLEDKWDKYEPRVQEARLLATALRTGDFDGALIDTIRSLGPAFEELLLILGHSAQDAALIRKAVGSALTIVEMALPETTE